MPQPTISPELLAQYAQYFDPSAFNVPAGGGAHSSSGNTLPLAATIGDPIGGGLLNSLLGGDETSWNPYIDENGNYVFADPARRNPVPVATTPGASLKPSSTYRKMADQVQAITDLLPAYNQAVSGQIIPNAQATLAAQQATSPGLAKLMTELYGTYGRQLNDIGNDINRTNALSQVGTDTAALNQARQTLIPSALEAAKAYDPEYFATRELSANRLKDLLNSIDLGSGLSPVEQREVEQGLAQEGHRRGTAGTPSSLDTVSNAMQYGQAGFNRLQTNRSALSTAIANATASLPAFKSGVDVFQVATGKSAMPNLGNSQFTGVNNVNNAASQSLGLATNLSGNANQLDITKMNIDANKKDWADYMNQVTSSISDIGSVAGGFAGCWIARRVYGNDNPKWKQFRNWLFTKAPESFREYYLQNGERISKLITDKQAIAIRQQMNMILEVQYVN